MGRKRKQEKTQEKSEKASSEPAPLPPTVSSDDLEPVAKKVVIPVS